MKISFEFLPLQIILLESAAKIDIVGQTVMIQSGVGQMRNQSSQRNHAVLIQNVMDIITNVWILPAIDLGKILIVKKMDSE